MRPRVTVVVPVLNGERTIGACLEALENQIDAPAREVIVVDNGSTDRTREIVAEYDVRLLSCETRGAAAARNRGLLFARGAVVAFTDADCRPAPRWLATGVETLEDHPSVAIVAGEITGTEPVNAIQGWMNRRRILDPRPPLRHPFLPFVQTANAFFRRDDLLRVGGFDEALRAGEDCDLSWRVQEVTGGAVTFRSEAHVEHDHRTSIRGIIGQAAHNASADAHLARKWDAKYAPKSLGRSVWELREVVRLGAVSALAWATGSADRLDRVLDAALSFGRKWGMVKTALRTGEIGRW